MCYHHLFTLLFYFKDKDVHEGLDTITLRRLGEASANLGELNQACGYYDQVLAHFSSHNCDAPWAKMCRAETHLLYSKALFQLGCYQQDHGDDEDNNGDVRNDVTAANNKYY